MLKLTSQALPVPVADGRSGVPEVAVSPRLADPGGVEKARVSIPALMEGGRGMPATFLARSAVART